MKEVEKIKKQEPEVFTEPVAKKVVSEVFNEKAIDEKGNRLLPIPEALCPGSGRLACIVFGKRDFKTSSGIIVPSFGGKKDDRGKVNPWSGVEYFVVAYDKEAYKMLDLSTFRTVINEKKEVHVEKVNVRIGIGDIILVGDEFIPVIKDYRGFTYAFIHYMDVVAVEKNPKQV